MTRRNLGAFGADLVCVLVFATQGRSAHHENFTLSGLLNTAWPFALGTLVGWVVLILTRREGQALASVAILVPATVAVGMIARALTDRSVAVTFILVASTVLTLLLAGWRLVAQWLGRRAALSTRTPPPLPNEPR